MSTALILFNQDLRISDNQAFFYALKNHKKILPLFILDEKNSRPLGDAAKWFLHHALENLSNEIAEKYSLKLVLKKGDSLKILQEIFKKEKISAVYFNKLVEPYNILLHEEITELATKNSIEVLQFLSQTVFDPEHIKNGSGNYFKIFTPFWKNCLKNSQLIPELCSEPEEKKYTQLELKSDDLELLPKKNWAKKFEKIWEFDIKKVKENLTDFLEKEIFKYAEKRDFPGLDSTSKISTYLNFGLISPRQLFFAAAKYGETRFLSEIGWREFCHHLLYHFPQLPNKNFRSEFDRFPWQKNETALKKWQMGMTGFPLVDAGMRELWATGFMHNRVRMVVGSFLVKDLLIDWRIGEKWFWDCLVDANLANNSANWQWVAGSGVEAAPYFRIFNPTLQAERFDKEGTYIRKWIPEIAKLPNRYIHAPWEADEKILKEAKITLGKTYPKPILDHKAARDMALAIYKSL